MDLAEERPPRHRVQNLHMQLQLRRRRRRPQRRAARHQQRVRVEVLDLQAAVAQHLHDGAEE